MKQTHSGSGDNIHGDKITNNYFVNNNGIEKERIEAINKELNSKNKYESELLPFQEILHEFKKQLNVLEDFYKQSFEKPYYIKEVCVKLNLLVGNKNSLFISLIDSSHIAPKTTINTDISGKYYTIPEYMELIAIEKRVNGKNVKATKLELIKYFTNQGGGAEFSWKPDKILKNLSSEIGILINGIDIIIYEIHSTARTIISFGKDYIPVIEKNVLIPLNKIEEARKNEKIGLFSESIKLYKEAIKIIENMFGNDFYELAGNFGIN